MMNKKIQWFLWTVLIVFLIFLPQIFGVYYTNMFLNFAIFAVFTLSVNVLFMQTGLWTFGHAIYFTTSAYATAQALLLVKGIALFSALGLGVLASLILALIVCPFVVRVTGMAFAMIHLAIGTFMFTMALKLRDLTGGEDGLSNFIIPPVSIPGILEIPLWRQPVKFYYFGIIVLSICAWLMWFLTRTPFGRMQVGVMLNSKRMDYLGIRVTYVKSVAYMIAALFAGAAGSIYAMFQNLVSPGDYLRSFEAIFTIIVGGIGSFFGPIIGTAALMFLSQVTVRFTERVDLVSGIVLMLVVIFAPFGITGLFRQVRVKVTAFLSSRKKMEKIS
jgi:branched-chain amino acid transport system permease protein